MEIVDNQISLVLVLNPTRRPDEKFVTFRAAPAKPFFAVFRADISLRHRFCKSQMRRNDFSSSHLHVVRLASEADVPVGRVPNS